MRPEGVQSQIIEAMRAAFPSQQTGVERYYAMMQYHLGWLDEQLQPSQADSGKLLRPALVLLANRALGGCDEQALPLAAGIQLLHDFSLIHDDIEDNSPTRRGRPAVWKLWGVAHGINAGDGMFALAHRAVHGLSDVGVPPQRVLSILREFEATILRICEGQYLDLTAEGRMDVPQAQYLRMIKGKTAVLMAAATGLGARVASDDEAQIAALWEFGEALGLAFQMQDDMLDIWGDPATTGKPFAADLLQRKMSLPAIHALAHASLADRQRFEALYQQESRLSNADLDVLLAVLERTGSRAYVEHLVQDEHIRARAALQRVKPVDQGALDDLWALAHSLLQRMR
jgi:geranylgeranyl diphosphate synthase type I